jgi:hypothetical protein
MMKPKHLFALAAALLVLGIALLVIPSPGEPSLQCVSESAPSSGFTDADQDNCPVSIESMNEYSDWSSGPRWDNIAGLVLIVAGLGTGGAAVVKARRKPTA